LRGGTWTVRYKRIGKLVAVQCVGLYGTGSYALGPPTDLMLPYKAVGTASLSGFMIDSAGPTYYPVTGYTGAASLRVQKLIHVAPALTDGVVSAAVPFAPGSGDSIYLSGTYEVD
jgi:hypothetical protein